MTWGKCGAHPDAWVQEHSSVMGVNSLCQMAIMSLWAATAVFKHYLHFLYELSQATLTSRTFLVIKAGMHLQHGAVGWFSDGRASSSSHMV